MIAMLYSKNSYLFLLLGLVLTTCRENEFDVLKRGKDVLQIHCLSCHGIHQEIESGTPKFKNMYDSLGIKKLNLVLLAEFNMKTDSTLEFHKNITLSKKEIEAVYIYLKKDFIAY